MYRKKTTHEIKIIIDTICGLRTILKQNEWEKEYAEQLMSSDPELGSRLFVIHKAQEELDRYLNDRLEGQMYQPSLGVAECLADIKTMKGGN